MKSKTLLAIAEINTAIALDAIRRQPEGPGVSAAQWMQYLKGEPLDVLEKALIIAREKTSDMGLVHALEALVREHYIKNLKTGGKA